MVQDRRHGMAMCKTNSYAGTNGNGGCYSSFYLHITYENGFTVHKFVYFYSLYELYQCVVMCVMFVYNWMTDYCMFFS